MAELIKKHNIALFINIGTSEEPIWKRIKKSTALTINMNPNTEERDYISDEYPTVELKNYKPSLNQPVTMYKGEADYDLMFDKVFHMRVGDDAKGDVLIAFYKESYEHETYQITYFKAWKAGATFMVSDLNAVDSVITCDIQFNGNTDIGAVTVSGKAPDEVPVFVKGTWSKTSEFTPKDPPPLPPPPTTYTVTFNADGGIGTDPIGGEYEEGETFTLPANPYTKEGFTFKKWAVDGLEYDAGDVITVGTSDIVVTAVWESVPVTYTVSFDSDGGTGTDPETATVVSGGTYTLPTNPYTKDGYTFTGWSVDGTDYNEGDEITVTEDTVVSAVWEQD